VEGLGGNPWPAGATTTAVTPAGRHFSFLRRRRDPS
jgi:hypothetical protein